MLPKRIILGKKHGMPTGLQSDSEFKEGGGKEVKHGIFQSIARKGYVRGLLDLKHDHGVKRLLPFALFSLCPRTCPT